MKGMKARMHIRPEIKPVFRKPHPVPHRLKAAVERELERLQEEGVIEPVRFSEWAAPIVPIVKEDGQVQICGDYRLTVNRASELESYPIPRINELFASMTGGVVFTKLDLKNTYQQLLLEDDSELHHH